MSLATKEQIDFIQNNIDKAIDNAIKVYGRWYWNNIYLERLNQIKIKLDYPKLLNMYYDDYVLVTEWAEDA